VAAVTIIWAAVIPMIKENTLGGTVCLDAVSGLSLGTEGGYTCKVVDDGTLNMTRLQVSHGAKAFTLEDIQVLVSVGGDTATFSAVNDNATEINNVASLGPNEVDVFEINIGLLNPDYVEIAPIIAVGASTKTCDVAAKVELPACTT
jgi:hypothetical protein